MKVLLLGEFSSLHKYLKDGLKANGHEVTLVHNGDNWKKIKGMDLSFPVQRRSGLVAKLNYLRDYEHFIDSFETYDVIQLINSTLIPALILPRCIEKLRTKCRCLSLAAAGSEYVLAQKYREGFFDWYVYDYDREALNCFNPNTVKGRKKIKNGKLVEAVADVIIPSSYEYQVGFAKSKKCWNVIPFPINIDILHYRPNIVDGKVMIYHGVIRELAKGTPIIREAMYRIKSKYPENIDILIKGGMPFEQYTEVMAQTNILVDQCCAYGYGINACVGLAQGKILMSSLRDETINSFGLSNSAVISIKPDADDIFEKLEKLIRDKDNFEKRGQESRKYVESLHNYKRVAQKYVEAWGAHPCRLFSRKK